MKVTSLHLQFWRERKANPTWQALIPRPKYGLDLPLVDVHVLINTQGASRRGMREISNMVATLRLARKNERHLPGEFLRCLASYAKPTYSTTSKRQAATARKWLNRIINRRKHAAS